MDTIIITALLVVFFAIMIGIGIYCRKHSTDVGGFVLGGRSIGPWLTAFAFGTSYFSAVIFVGYAGQFGWNFGLASTWIGLGNAFIGSLLAWVVLGRRTRVMTQHLGSRTMPDFFGNRFDSPALKIAASCITFIFLIPYTASLYNGLSRLFSMAYEGIDYSVCVIVMAALTGVYVLLGGYVATAINDFIQGIIMLVGIVAVIGSVLNANGGLNAAIEKLATGENGGWEYASFLGADPVFLLFVVLLTSLGTWGLPQMVGKFYAIKDEDAIKKGTVISTVFAVIVAGGCYFLGGFGRLYDVSDAVAKGDFDTIIPTMLSTLPTLIIAIVIVLVLSASMSTLSSLVLTSSSTVTLDFIAPLCEKKKPMNEKKQMLCIRAFIVVFIVFSAVIAIMQYQNKNMLIAQMMGVSWGALAGAFLAPFLYGLYWKKTTRAAVVTSFVFGVGLEIVQLLISMKVFSVANIPVLSFVFRNSLFSGVFAMVGGLILVPIVSLLTQKTAPTNTDEIFSCYERTATVTVTDSLGGRKERLMKYMEIIKIDKSHVTDVKNILQQAYLPLLEKYHDEQKNPANKTAEDILLDLERENSNAYLLILNNEPIGYVRVGERAKGEFSIADLAILPSHQGNGYAQYLLKKIEKIYYMAKKWSLVTIQEETKLCHLYEKFGYIQKGVLEEVNENMHFVLYAK